MCQHTQLCNRLGSSAGHRSGEWRHAEIVGSHKWGLRKSANTFGEKNLEELADCFRREDQSWADQPCILKAGQVSFHHALTFHGSGPNLTSEPRLCFIVHMMPADCAVNEAGRYHQNLDLLGPDKRTGDLFAGACFPRIWAKGM